MGKQDEAATKALEAMTKAMEERLLRGNVAIVRTGEQIIIPEDMEYAEAREWLTRREKEEDQMSAIHVVIDAFPLEGAYALAEVLKRKYGFVAVKWSTLVDIEVGVGQAAQVPWGVFEIPGIAGSIEPDITFKDGRLQFVLGGKVKNKHKAEIAALVKDVRTQLSTASIYRGHALRIQFAEDPSQLDPRDGPKFIDTASVNADELVFSKDIERIVRTTLFTPIERTEECRKYGVPLKRGVLLEGPYGVGKTLTANVVAKKCVENRWTFIALKDVKQLAHAIEFAKQYQPAVIFAEDIDRVVKGERTTGMDEILNTIDGVGGKANEIFVVLTTNDVNAINRAMLRPGRLDAVVTVEPPDAAACARLIKLYARGLLDEADDFSKAAALLDGKIPSVIREVVERSKLAAIGRMKPGEPMLLKGVDIEIAADTMIRHLELLREAKKDDRSDMEKAAEVIASALAPGKDASRPNGNGAKASTSLSQ